MREISEIPFGNPMALANLTQPTAPCLRGPDIDAT
jgi:hypothetical protein